MYGVIIALMAISKEFQNRFIELSEELDTKKKTDTAKKIGITYATFSNAYNYGILPTVPILIRIADYFNISVEYLIANTDSEYFCKSLSPKTFSERLEEQRQKKNIDTVYELSQRIHIHRNNIANWLKNDYIPELDDLTLLANFFDVSIDYMLGRTDDDTPYGDK